MKSGKDCERKGRKMPRACRSDAVRDEEKRVRETTTHIRELDGDLGNILITSLMGNARNGEEVQNDEGGMEVKRAVRKLTRRKAGGMCGIHVAMVKVGGCTVLQWLKECLMWLGNVERHLKNGGKLLLYLPIYMKGCRAECGIYKE